MKRKFLACAVILLTLISCSLSNDNNDGPTEIVITNWNLINVTGGIAGVDHNFEIGEIIWFFDEINDVLSVTNNNPDDSLEDGLDTGNYHLLFQIIDDKIYMFVEFNEFGELIISGIDNEDMTIDQNSLSTGQGSDGFIYTFKKTTTTVEL